MGLESKPKQNDLNLACLDIVDHSIPTGPLSNLQGVQLPVEVALCE